MDKHLVLICSCMLAAGFLRAQVHTSGPQVLTFLSDVDDSDQPYARRFPLELNAGAADYGLVFVCRQEAGTSW